ncbi:chromatin modification-related protein eaf-1-like isoform X2 [Phragmites australis]|uniref:chromatin modification-related protein eaf-1-like isoform X2 n=1 Tax=Phragmites australis TaxID=29695 RepID=UPI002D780958|nr:chromatin modification-related protein eaf-1-like isoform X2 [Phragmites australis]
MASPARPAAVSVSGAFGLSPDPKRCSFDQPLRREDFQENRFLMSFVNFHEQEKISKGIITEAIENCMKKQADNLLNSLEVISGRLSQLELYCYKLERSIGELRSDVMDYHGEANLNFHCLEKHVKEVQKSVQVLQDKQELAETQKELSKLQIVHEDSSQKSEGTAPSILMTRENELTLVPMHQVNAVQSPAMQFQSCNGLILQQLVPVSLSAPKDQQRSNQTTMYCMQGQSHLEHRQAQPLQAGAQSVQSQTQNPQPQTVVEIPQITSQAPEFYFQPQQQWPHQTVQHVQSQARQPQPQVVQQQQYNNIQQVPAQVVQLQTSSPQAHSAPQVTLVYPPYGSHQPANTEAHTRGMVVQPSYSTISSAQRHHEVAPVYVQSSAISVPFAEHRQQPHQLHPLSNSSFGPQQTKVGPCGVAAYTVQGSAQNYNTAYGSPSSNPATVFAVLNQQAHASAPMVLHHLGPQTVQNHPVDIVEKAARMGYSKDQVDSMVLCMATASQPVEFNPMHDRLSSISNGVAAQAWSG